MFKNVIFDLDGTLINSSKEVLICFEKAFKKANYKIDKSRLTPNVIGPPLKEIIKLIAPDLTDENVLQNIVEIFRGIYDNDENDISEFYPGIMELLNCLQASCVKLFIATYKPDKPTVRIVKQFNLNMFEDIYTIDKFGVNISKVDMINDILKKYNLKKDHTVMIGDAPTDVMAAKETGITGIGALWGYGNDKSKLKEFSDYVVNDVFELKSLLISHSKIC